MQMGRWFGYRRGYPDLVRLYMARRIKGAGKTTYDLYEAFGAIMRDEEQFREQLETFAGLGEAGRPLLHRSSAARLPAAAVVAPHEPEQDVQREARFQGDRW